MRIWLKLFVLVDFVTQAYWRCYDVGMNVVSFMKGVCGVMMGIVGMMWKVSVGLVGIETIRMRQIGSLAVYNKQS